MRETNSPEKHFLAALCARLTVDDIKLISTADCRSDNDFAEDAPKHFKPLLDIQSHLDFSSFDGWYPGEVLELCRWSKPLASEVKSHEIRAFSCAAIIQAVCDVSGYNFIAMDSSLGNLLESVLCIDNNLFKTSEGFFAHILNCETLSIEETAFILIAQFLAMLETTSEEELTYQLGRILKSESEAKNYNLMAFDRRLEFFGNFNRPQMDDGWRFVSNHIYTKSQNFESELLRAETQALCKRLWNPEPSVRKLESNS